MLIIKQKTAFISHATISVGKSIASLYVHLQAKNNIMMEFWIPFRDKNR